ncbi:lipopolysaccharide biosynthesis protein [Dysgonomonas sp. Marseille-P4677]|uniref:lipopolysaccharide biosynthesis protein n=1 Tax=Dysgonomonas sp. Marseille-P4677 TaxID=2364790 RepID=UPI001911F6A8|nr:lipopolysaccharide biosynthesis protein [Dysgonomonas sp. Marseille-P4677]MBK5719452.1 lipopolysaccharide biosynthesis protein [Dysgonomonas sp. Marseille-P4677]
MLENPIKKQLIGGVFYTAISKYAGIIVSLVISAILARLISPEDFGVVAIATVLITFFSIFSDLGIGPAIVQNQNLKREDYSNIFSFTVYIGLTISLLFFCCSWLLGAYYKEEILIYICQILSINIFFASINIVPNALLLKEKKFKFIAYRTLIFQLVGGLISVFAAFMGAGIYALLINPILTSIGIFFVNFYVKPQSLVLKINCSSLKLISTFSVYQFLFNFINYFSRNLDKLVIGRYIGMSPLGYYDKSYRLMMLPLQNITHVITPVMHPVFAGFQNDLKQLSSHYLKIVRFLSFISFPLSILLFFTSKELILLVFGDQWIGSIPVFKILSLSVGIQIILSTSGSIFQAANTTKALFVSGLFSAIVNVLGLIIAILAFRSINAVAWALVITFTFNFFQCYWMMYCQVFKERFVIFFKHLVSPLIVTIIMAIVLYIVSDLTEDLYLILSLIIKSVIFVVILASYIQLRKEYDLLGLVKNKMKK